MNLADLDRAMELRARLTRINNIATEVNGGDPLCMTFGPDDDTKQCAIVLPGPVVRGIIDKLRRDTIEELGKLGVHMPPLAVPEVAA